MTSLRIFAGFAFLGLAALARLGAAEPPAPHTFLQQLCDDFGGRLTGSAGNVGAMGRLEDALRALGLKPVRQSFTMPGWERGDDRVELLAPFARRLRVAALSYTEAHPAFEAAVIDLGLGRPGDYPANDVSGKVGLLAAGTPLQASEIVAGAQARGLRGVLFINREGGGQLLARTGGFTGEPLPLPIYSIAREEGLWLQRLLARGQAVQVRMETKSRCLPVETANLVATIPGNESGRVIVGAHFDSWDLGQGAMDNGIGIAQLYALARALREAKPQCTIELIWFNGEEQGLWGSRHAASLIDQDPIVAMVNLDMVGVPVSVNALGDASLVPALERWHAARPESARLPKGVENINWVGSDHTPYQLRGIRAVTFNAPIPRESVRYYHDFADTIDKVSPKLIDDSVAVILDVVLALANDAELGAWRRTREDTEALFTRFGLERRLRAMSLWPFAAVPLPAGERSEELRREAVGTFGQLEAPAVAATTSAMAELGRALFWDTRLSANSRISCASCHASADGGADRARFSLDARERRTARNSQTVFNAMLQPSLRWTGDRTSGTHQAERSLTGSMGFDQADAVVPLLRRHGYESSFRRAFVGESDPVTPRNYARALEAYQATLVTPAPFDRFLAGDAAALDDQQRKGLEVFMKVGCADCHHGPLLGGARLKKFGVTKDYWLATGSEKRDAGVFETTKIESDRNVFRVSMLRNIAATAPYFHDGSVADLREAVQVMADVQLGGRLPDADASAIVAFLRSLSGSVPSNYAPPDQSGPGR